MPIPDATMKDGEVPDFSTDARIVTISDLTDSRVLAKPEQPKSVKVKSPLGYTSEVPASLVETLIASGYSKTK